MTPRFAKNACKFGFAMVHRVVVTAAALVAAAVIIVIVAANGRTGTEAPLAAAVVSEEETARRLETAGLGGIFRRRSRFNIPAGSPSPADHGPRWWPLGPPEHWQTWKPCRRRGATAGSQRRARRECSLSFPRVSSDALLPTRRYRSYTATVTELQRLVKQRPDLAKLWSTQERYGLQTAGVCECVLTRTPLVVPQLGSCASLGRA